MFAFLIRQGSVTTRKRTSPSLLRTSDCGAVRRGRRAQPEARLYAVNVTGVSRYTRASRPAVKRSPRRKAARTSSSFRASSSERYGPHPSGQSVDSTSTSATYSCSRISFVVYRQLVGDQLVIAMLRYLDLSRRDQLANTIESRAHSRILHDRAARIREPFAPKSREERGNPIRAGLPSARHAWRVRGRWRPRLPRHACQQRRHATLRSFGLE